MQRGISILFTSKSCGLKMRIRGCGMSGDSLFHDIIKQIRIRGGYLGKTGL